MTFETNDFIELRAVTKNFKDPESDIYFQALRGIDLSIRKGSMSAIIGPSGAGKSTLLNIIGGNLAPTTGEVRVDNHVISTLNLMELHKYRRHMCGFLWQNPEHNLLSHISAKDNIIHAMEISGYPKGERKKKALDLLDSLGLKARASHKLGQLSGGEAQRAGLAVALANEPKLLLADEPTGELDSETTLEIVDYLRELNREQGLTIVVVTHDMRFENLTDHSFNIMDGVIASYREVNGQVLDHKIGPNRSEMSVVNRFGMVKIPENIMKAHGISKFVKFEIKEKSGKIVIRPIKDEELL
ncbi:MAG: ATP-binding cassette domain-containing protein [Candidatus Heimdallarchaeota archaeon]|nr:ATP-binding cassette domain-containing protein [Candidatus Heimdallarchaeota archaeon]